MCTCTTNFGIIKIVVTLFLHFKEPSQNLLELANANALMLKENAFPSSTSYTLLLTLDSKPVTSLSFKSQFTKPVVQSCSGVLLCSVLSEWFAQPSRNKSNWRRITGSITKCSVYISKGSLILSNPAS